MKTITTRHAHSLLPRPSRKWSLAAAAVSGALLFTGCGRERPMASASTDSETTPTAYETTTTSQTSATPPMSANPSMSAASSATSSTGQQQVQDSATLVLDEEKLDVQKREVQSGGVLISKDVETRTVNQPVELREETVEVERLTPEEARERGVQTQGEAQKIDEKDVYIPLSREEAVVQKEVQPREVVTARTDSETKQENVDATLRREVVDVQRTNQQPASAQNQAGMQSGQLEQRIRTELRNADLGLQEQQLNQIQIQVQQDTVTLSGNVPSQDIASQIEDRVNEIDGVENVRNQLRASR